MNKNSENTAAALPYNLLVNRYTTIPKQMVKNTTTKRGSKKNLSDIACLSNSKGNASSSRVSGGLNGS
ncbi:MAG TPA: hypothetical protein VMR41_00680 [Patescibacteria group bacterium]|nr:hypothetical protein [Patescibacteria group bacterium]